VSVKPVAIQMLQATVLHRFAGYKRFIKIMKLPERLE
jgi:hypothetical protein